MKYIFILLLVTACSSSPQVAINKETVPDLKNRCDEMKARCINRRCVVLTEMDCKLERELAERPDDVVDGCVRKIVGNNIYTNCR